MTVVVLLWDSHLGAEEVLVRNLFNRGNINKVRDVGFDPVFVFGEFTELDSQVGVRVVCACGVANKMEFVFLVQSTEGVRLNSILVVLHGVEVRDENIVVVGGVSGKTQHRVGVSISYEIMQTNVEQPGIGIYLFKEGLDDVTIVGVPLFDDVLRIGIGAEEAFSFENSVVIDMVLVNNGFLGRSVVFSDG